MLLRAALLGTAGALAFLGACSETKLAAQGEECFVAADCRPGLVCIEEEDLSRRCTNDPSRAAGRVPPEAAAPDAGDESSVEAGEAGDAGLVPDTSTGPGPADTGPDVRDADRG